MANKIRIVMIVNGQNIILERKKKIRKREIKEKENETKIEIEKTSVDNDLHQIKIECSVNTIESTVKYSATQGEEDIKEESNNIKNLLLSASSSSSSLHSSSFSSLHFTSILLYVI